MLSRNPTPSLNMVTPWSPSSTEMLSPRKEDLSGITQHETQHRTHLGSSTQSAEMSASVSCCSSSEKIRVTFFDALEREHKVGGNISGNPKT